MVSWGDFGAGGSAGRWIQFFFVNYMRKLLGTGFGVVIVHGLVHCTATQAAAAFDASDLITASRKRLPGDVEKPAASFKDAFQITQRVVLQHGLEPVRIVDFPRLKPITAIGEEMHGAAVGPAEPELRAVRGEIANMIVNSDTYKGE